MNRKIKFRAFYKANQKMYDVLTLDIIDEKALIENNDNPEKPLRGYVKMTEIKLMQYTGLKDKNGKEIYEGDIIKNNNNYKFKVIWDETRFIGVDSVRDGSGYICYIDSHYKDGKSRLEIIGNIHDNPELMEEKK